MTTDRQRRANRLNAMKSKGPRTAEGKKRSSENSRKHGLASALDKEGMDKWLCTILDIDPGDFDLKSADTRLFAALELAEAEATLERAQQFEEFQELIDHLGGPGPPPGETATLEDLLPTMEGALDTRALSRDDWVVGMAVLKLVETARRHRERDFNRLTRLSRRYRREAESFRRAALKRWLEVEYPETNPISS